MPVKVTVTLNVSAMTEFMIYHLYTGAAGIAVLGLGALNVGMALAFGMRGNFPVAAVFLIFALLLFLGFPKMIKRRIEGMKESKRLTEPVTYEFGEDGIRTETSERTGQASWKKFCKAVLRKNILILYDAQRRAIILPVDQLGDKYGDVVAMIKAHMPPGAVRIKDAAGTA